MVSPDYKKIKSTSNLNYFDECVLDTNNDVDMQYMFDMSIY